MYNKSCLLLLLTLVSALPSPAKAQVSIKKSYLKGVPFVKLTDVAGYYGTMKYRASGNKFYLKSAWTTVEMTRGSRRCKVNGNLISLSHGTDKIGSIGALSVTDFTKLLDPILRGESLVNRRVSRIIIDPGHGGKDRGAKGRTYTEKAVALDISKKLATLLRGYGFQVYLTRTGDSFPSLASRPAFAKKRKGDLFLSIHCNSATAAAKGIETFLITPKGASSTSGGSKRKKTTTANTFDKYNARLAYEVQNALVAQTRAVDRGIKHAQFVVLDRAPCPAALIEIGFLSNRGEERLLGSRSYQNKVALGIARGVMKYIKAVRK
ncbi:MAG: N-acetylmuramoyl-L-alanine amidase [Lentisphaeria bacterium]|nr:N-acetylmuramoyl-L-alanine amidase [Lentisphaeria bacterium]